MYFLTVGPETPVAAAMPLTDSPLLALLLISSTLSTPIISFPDLLMSKSDRIDNCRSKAAVGAGLTISENFRLPEWKAAFTIFVNQTLPNTRETDYHRYSSYRGVVGETSGSVIGRDFAADGPWRKMGTDVAEFRQPWGKACFAPVHDFGSEEMVAWSASASPDMARQAELLDRLLAKMPEGATPALHGDMGRQHRHAAWRGRLRGAGIVQSMSRKGNCIDNGATEQVFGHMRDEFFRGRAWPDFESSKADLDACVAHWNTRRRRVKLKGLTPEEFRNQPLAA